MENPWILLDPETLHDQNYNETQSKKLKFNFFRDIIHMVNRLTCGIFWTLKRRT